jgi:hypothetical protein
VDGGSQWQDITPPQLLGGRILGAVFRDERYGWVVAQLNAGSSPVVVVLRTDDGGLNWDSTELPALTEPESQAVDTAHLNVVDTLTAWVMVKLQSGSSFSLGRLFVTRDGGVSWETRDAPAGDPVSFIDANTGWMVGGPAQDSIYYTRDGGQTWQLQTIALPQGERAILGIPWFDSNGAGWLPVVYKNGAEEKLVYYASRDRGETWSVVPGFLSESPGAREALLETNSSLLNAVPGELLAQASLPEGAYWVDFSGDGAGWAAVRSGSCKVDSTSGGKHCEIQNLLLSTLDGGVTWEPVCSPDVPCFEGITSRGVGE